MAETFKCYFTPTQEAEQCVVQYYEILQYHQNIVHMCFWYDSNMLRIDGNTKETATNVLEIMSLVATLGDMHIEIKSKHSLESWDGGVLVIVWGSAHINNFLQPKLFMETFFLAPHGKEYLILNDIFQYVDDEHIEKHSDVESHASNTQEVQTAPEEEAVTGVGVGVGRVDTRLHIGNLPKYFDNRKVTELVEEIACPVLVKVVRNKNKRSKHAFVTMSSVKERNLVVDCLNGKKCGDLVLTASAALNPNPR